jgi:hypothetical protein
VDSALGNIACDRYVSIRTCLRTNVKKVASNNSTALLLAASLNSWMVTCSSDSWVDFQWTIRRFAPENRTLQKDYVAALVLRDDNWRCCFLKSLSGRRHRLRSRHWADDQIGRRGSRLFRMNVRMPGHVYRDNAISPAHPFSPQMVGSAHPASWQQNGMDTAVGSRGGLLAGCTLTSGKAETDWVRQFVKWGMRRQSDINVWANSLEQSLSWGANLCLARIQETPSILWNSEELLPYPSTVHYPEPDESIPHPPISFL